MLGVSAMKDYEILFLDMDGTILRPDHTIEESTITAINEMKKKGIEVVLATGRPLHEILDTAKELKIDSFIAYNGAFAIYKGQEVFKEYMKHEIVTEYLSVAENKNHDLIFYTRTNNLPTNLESPRVKDFLNEFDLRKNKLFTTNIMNDILAMTVITNEQSERIYYPKFDGIFLSPVNVAGMHHCFDVIMENVNKGVAVQSMLEHLNIPREHSIAFGDGLNDKEMISFVGEGFAMGNGHPDLFSYAKHTTSTVNDSGIYNGLKSLGLLK